MTNATIPKVIVAACIVLFVLAAVSTGCLFYFRAHVNREDADPAKQAEMVDASQRWGRLAPFPKTAQGFAIHTEGTAFTRTFKGSFADSPEAVSKWLQNSPGVSAGKTEVQRDQSTKHVLKMGEGASYGEVIVSPDGKSVAFKISWS